MTNRSNRNWRQPLVPSLVALGLLVAAGTPVTVSAAGSAVDRIFKRANTFSCPNGFTLHTRGDSGVCVQPKRVPVGCLPGQRLQVDGKGLLDRCVTGVGPAEVAVPVGCGINYHRVRKGRDLCVSARTAPPIPKVVDRVENQWRAVLQRLLDQ